MVGEDDGPWGALVVLDAKQNQENVPWHRYQWRICMSYRKLNQVTCPFFSPIPHCNDTVQDIDKETNYFIDVYTDSGYQ